MVVRGDFVAATPSSSFLFFFFFFSLSSHWFSCQISSSLPSKRRIAQKGVIFFMSKFNLVISNHNYSFISLKNYSQNMICRGLEFFFYRLKREALAMQTCFKKVKKKKNLGA
jgi:hypothetical protein